jgi:hypothetical protein
MIVNNVIPNKLHQELINSGVECSVFHNLEDGRYYIGDCEIMFAENTDMNLVQQIIDAHDPTPLPPQPTTEELQIEYNIDLDYRISLIEMGLV